MKTNTCITTLAALLGGLHICSADLIISGNDGSDGDFEPLVSREIDLSQAVSGPNVRWDTPVPAGSTGRGVYDPDQWAVVFKFQSVNIPSGVSVTFKNHPSRAPVVWLVQGNVTIIGPGNAAGAAPAINLNGQRGLTGNDANAYSEPGPGGFRGGPATPGTLGVGLGFGGGRLQSNFEYSGQYAGFYGNPRLLPLIGGSGGRGVQSPAAGTGGGGAILIASAGSLTLSGKITASGQVTNGVGFSGSGGGVRLVANAVTGSGRIEATGEGAIERFAGRIRIESRSPVPAGLISVPDAVAVDPGLAPVIWPPSNAPKVRILKVAEANAPDEPTAPLASGADIGIQNSGQVEIFAETTNFPIEGQVTIRVSPKTGNVPFLLTAAYVSGNNARATWKAPHTFGSGYSTLQARAIAP